MKHFWLQLAVSVPLAIAMGCGAEGSDGSNGPKECLGVCTPVDNDAGGNDGTGGDTGTVQSGLVVAKAPQGLTGDFYFEDDLLCGGASSCEANVDGSITIKFVCPTHLFIPKIASGNPKTDTTVVWDQPGDWGLAPNGTYSKEDGNEHAVKTTVENTSGQHQVLLWEDEDVIGAVSGNTFSWDAEYAKYSGTVSDDLKTIVYHIVAKNGNEIDETLTLVE